MKILACSLLLALLAPRGDCDLAKVEKAFYCESCVLVLTKADLVSNKVYYACTGCGSLSTGPGKCDDCDEPRAKRTSGTDVCGSCYEKPEECLACVKEYFECPECGAQAAKAGNCEECKTAMKHQISRALVEFECPACGERSRQPGKCETEGCSRMGKAYERVCSASGEFPHSTEDHR